MLDWIARHSVGWQYFLPGLLLSAVLLTLTRRPHYRNFTPWGVLVPWIGVAVILYLAFGIDRHWYGAREYWLAMTGTLLLASGIPFGAMTLLARRPTLQERPPIAAGVLTFGLGLVTIPLAGFVSGVIGQILIPILIARRS